MTTLQILTTDDRTYASVMHTTSSEWHIKVSAWTIGWWWSHSPSPTSAWRESTSRDFHFFLSGQLPTLPVAHSYQSHSQLIEINPYITQRWNMRLYSSLWEETWQTSLKTQQAFLCSYSTEWSWFKKKKKMKSMQFNPSIFTMLLPSKQTYLSPATNNNLFSRGMLFIFSQHFRHVQSVYLLF